MNPSPDKLFHVQVGPFADIKDAESARAKLVSDGYNPILKKYVRSRKAEFRSEILVHSSIFTSAFSLLHSDFLLLPCHHF